MAHLGKYQLVAEIARGGMGIVYLAVVRGPGRFSKLLVVKQLKPELVDDASFLELFLEEARLAARLNHPNIVQTYEVGSDAGQHFIVMDYLEGATLSRIVRRKSHAFTLAMHLRVIAEALRGLEHAHKLVDFDGTPLGMVHCDASPQNVFLTWDGQVKLVDFGIARALDSTIETTAGVLKGKPSYMAPEQIAGDVDPRSDVFSAGAMIWEAVAGRRLWESCTDVEILTHVIRGEVPSLATVAPEAPPELVRIVEKAMARSPEDRYPTAGELRAELEAYLASRPDDVDARGVAETVSELFASERATTRAMIEMHLATLARLEREEARSSARMVAALPTLETSRERALHENTHTHAIESSLTSGMGRTPPGTEVPTMPAPPLVAPRLLVAGTSAVAMALLATGLLVRTIREGHVTAAASPPAPAAGRVVEPSPREPLTHEVTLRASPAEGVLTIDGAIVGNPVKKVCIHGRAFVVQATAPGRLAATRTVDCTRDEVLALGLDLEPPPAPAPTPAPAAVMTTRPAPKAPEPGAVVPPPRADPPAPASNEADPDANRPIDPSSPYNHEP